MIESEGDPKKFLPVFVF